MIDSCFFSSESVSGGHPDKIADQISDLVLDYLINLDSKCRSAIEVLVTTNTIVVAGEYRLKEELKFQDLDILIRNYLKEVGYSQTNFDADTLNIHNYLHSQSQDIALGVDSIVKEQEGAGDQGIIFGYACDDTPVYMPFAIYYCHKLLKYINDGRLNGEFSQLLSDAKSQISVEYNLAGEIRKIVSVVLSHQHKDTISLTKVRSLLLNAMTEVLPAEYYNPKSCEHYINPTGRFVVGGPDGDTGLTGRKIVVDTYGGYARHGGGAFSGKDCSKVDRSAAYMSRYLAKNIVATGLVKRCSIQLAYVIGIHEAVSCWVNTEDTGLSKLQDAKLSTFIFENIDLSPYSIRKRLKLNNSIYLKTASYGHFGRIYDGKNFTWEALDLVSYFTDVINNL